MSDNPTDASQQQIPAVDGVVRPTVTVRRTAELLDVSEGLVRKKIGSGELESTKIGARRLVYRDSIARMQMTGNRQR
jgi:excisionase family DNA binding protein